MRFLRPRRRGAPFRATLLLPGKSEIARPRRPRCIMTNAVSENPLCVGRSQSSERVTLSARSNSTIDRVRQDFQLLLAKRLLLRRTCQADRRDNAVGKLYARDVRVWYEVSPEPCLISKEIQCLKETTLHLNRGDSETEED
jgi:hypothetical protein